MTGPTTPTPLPTVNQTASSVSTVVGAVGNAGVEIVEGMIISAQPWLGLPGIKQIWEALFGYIAGFFVTAAQTGVSFAVIDTQTTIEVSGMSTALAGVVAAEKSGDKNAIALAIKAYQAAQSALINSDGSAVIK